MKTYKPFKCRASSVGKLMTRMSGDNLGNGTVEVLLADVINQAYGYYREIDAKQVNKGNALEDEAIRLVSLLMAIDITKNKESRSNKWFTGTCDILRPDSTRDTKCSWSIDSFPLTQKQAEDMVRKGGYDWQGQIYMMLWGVKKHYIDFILLPTPRDQLKYNDDEYMHIDLVESMPIEKRIRTVEIDYNSDWINKAKDMVSLVQPHHMDMWNSIVDDKYMVEVINNDSLAV